MKKYKVLGILGGMGPETTVLLYFDIIQRFQLEFGAKYKEDFPHIIINSVPLPSGKMWKNFNEKEVIQSLQKNAQLLENAGVDFIVISCNSSHYFIDTVQKAVNIPIINIVKETTKKIKENNIDVVAVLGTEFTVSRKVYDTYLEKNGIRVVELTKEQRKKTEQAIVNVKAGNKLKKDKAELMNIIKNLQKKGVEGVILGCTEIPLLIDQKDSPITVFDTLDILGEVAFENLKN